MRKIPEASSEFVVAGLLNGNFGGGAAMSDMPHRFIDGCRVFQIAP